MNKLHWRLCIPFCQYWELVFIDDFSGRVEKSAGCVCLCVCQIDNFERNYLSYLFGLVVHLDHMSIGQVRAWVKVRGHRRKIVRFFLLN